MSDRTQDLKNLRAVATACKNYVDETKEQILWQVGQYDISTQDDNTTAYQKAVPTGATRAKIKSIGGMSYKSENLIVLQDIAETTTNGITYKVENGVITLNGTATAQTKFSFEFINAIPKNKDYYVLLFISGTTTATNPKAIGETNTDARLLIPATTTFNVDYDIKYLWFSAGNGTVWTNYTIKPMIVNGSTAPTEFKVGFTGIRDSVITSVKSYDSNNNLIDTYTIDSHIQALTGYGKGISNDLYNYIDLDTKKYSYDCDLLNNITISSISSISNETNKFYAFAKPSNIDDTKGLYSSNYICDKYPVRQQSSLTDTSLQYSIVVNINRNVAYLCLPTSLDYTIEQAQALINGTNIIYPTTLQETDISEYITNNVIEVEEGGYLVFENQYGQAVPSNVTYRIEVAK